MNKLKQKFLIDRIRKGDTEAFGEIYDEYMERVYRFIFFRVPNQEIAQDLAHDVFVKLLDYIKNKDNKIWALQAFIYKICRNDIAQYYSSGQVAYDQAFELSEEIDPRVDKTLRREKKMDEEFDVSINLKLVKQHIESIEKKEYKEIIILRFIEDLNYKEISKIIGKSPGALKTLLHRALKELREIIKQSETTDASE